jgi:hypothetical protein
MAAGFLRAHLGFALSVSVSVRRSWFSPARLTLLCGTANERPYYPTIHQGAINGLSDWRDARRRFRRLLHYGFTKGHKMIVLVIGGLFLLLLACGGSCEDDGDEIV